MRFFYWVNFDFTDNHGTHSFDLGVFSSIKNAKQKINNSKDLPGFKDYSSDCFSITKIGVHNINRSSDKSKCILYCVTNEIEDEWNIFGYYSTLSEANEKMQELIKTSRIGKKHPNSFYVYKVPVDSFTDWSEGFNSY